MSISLLLSFLGASIILTLMPGPDNILVLTESITKGKRNGIALSAGLCSGVLIHTLAAATGLSLIIQHSTIVFKVIKYLGAAYLFYLAIMTLQEQKQETNILQEGKGHFSFWSLFKKGFVMNILNPKVSLFFIAFLPQFISKSGFHITVQMIILGLIFMLQAFIIFSLISILSGRLSSYLNNDRFWQVTKYSKAVVLIILGIALLLSHS